MGRWRPPDSSRRRELTAIAINLGGALTAIVGFVLLAPTSDWSDPALIAALAGISAIAYLSEARLKVASLAFFGATLIVALVALALAGPAPGAARLDRARRDRALRAAPRAAVLARASIATVEQLRTRPAGRRRAAGARRRSRGSGDRSGAVRGRGRDVGDQLLRSPGSLSRPSTRATDPRRWSATSSHGPGPRRARHAHGRSRGHGRASTRSALPALAAARARDRRPARLRSSGSSSGASAAKLARAEAMRPVHRGDRRRARGTPRLAPRARLRRRPGRRRRRSERRAGLDWSEADISQRRLPRPAHAREMGGRRLARGPAGGGDPAGQPRPRGRRRLG